MLPTAFKLQAIDHRAWIFLGFFFLEVPAEALKVQKEEVKNDFTEKESRGGFSIHFQGNIKAQNKGTDYLDWKTPKKTYISTVLDFSNYYDCKNNCRYLGYYEHHITSFKMCKTMK